MAVVDGFVLAAPKASKEKLIAFAGEVEAAYKENGALQFVECWEIDVPKGMETDFYHAVKAKEDEAVVFAWILWPDKATRDAGMEKIMSDPRFHHENNPAPFDTGRMIFGCFETIVGG